MYFKLFEPMDRQKITDEGRRCNCAVLPCKFSSQHLPVCRARKGSVQDGRRTADEHGVHALALLRRLLPGGALVHGGEVENIDISVHPGGDASLALQA